MAGNLRNYIALPGVWQAAAIAGVILLTSVAIVLAWAFPIWPGDEALLLTVQSWQSPPLTAALGTLTYLGWYPVAAAVSLSAVLALLWRRHLADALLFAIAVSSAMLTHPLKALVGRPRPDLAIVEPVPLNMAFPSGHAAFAMLLGGVLIYLVWQNVEDRRLRWSLGGALTLLILGVGLSRVYLGVHWPSDVIGGYLLGLSVLLVLAPMKSCVARVRRLKTAQGTIFPKVGI